MKLLVPAAGAIALACAVPCVHAQQQGTSSTDAVQAATPDPQAKNLATVKINASADASAEGLSPAYAGGQVARGARVGILGTQDAMDTPFSITSYTSDFIQDRQARSVGDVLGNDPSVRVARGYGNFQETYFIRGFLLNSDDTSFNGLYSILPRQYIPTELFERVELLRGASAFLTGVAPSSTGIGGAVNLLPKRAPDEPLNRVTVGLGTGVQGNVSADIARRFGPDNSTGIRLNTAYSNGETGVDGEKAALALGSLGLDWRNDRARLSADIGWQNNNLQNTRPSVMLDPALAQLPAAPKNSSNFGQPWTYSNERDVFGTLRGEYDLSDSVTAWAAYGTRHGKEGNSLATFTVTDGATGDANVYRFDNTRKDDVNTGEVGLRGKFDTGPIGHQWVASGGFFNQDTRNAYVMDYFNQLATNLYQPVSYGLPDVLPTAFTGNDLASPALSVRTRLYSAAVGDTLSMFDNKFLLTLGARYQHMQVENFAYGTGAVSNYEKSRTSPMAGAVYKLDKQVSLYANYIEALSQGDTAPSNSTTPGAMLSPYVSHQKEVGVKYDGGKIGGSLALFSTNKPRAFLSADGTFSASGEDRHQGIEATVFGAPLRSLRVLGGFTILDAKQRNTGDAAVNGNYVIGVPRFLANAGVEWDIPGVNGLAVDGRVTYTGSTYANDANTLRAPSWTRLDAGLRYITEIQGTMVTLRARINNLTNRSYWASVGGYPGYGYLVAGAPRTFMLTATFDF